MPLENEDEDEVVLTKNIQFSLLYKKICQPIAFDDVIYKRLRKWFPENQVAYAKVFGSFVNGNTYNDIDIAFCDKESLLKFLFTYGNSTSLPFHYCLLNQKQFENLPFEFSCIRRSTRIINLLTGEIERYDIVNHDTYQYFINPNGAINKQNQKREIIMKEVE